MKLTANQINKIYKAIADLFDMLSAEREHNNCAEPVNDDIYNELNAAFASLQAALELGLNNKKINIKN